MNLVPLAVWLALLLAAVAAAVFFRRAVGRQAPRTLALCAAGEVLFGLLMGSLAAFHLVGVLVITVRTAAGGGEFQYDFRFYSLLLLGAVLLTLSVCCVRAAPGLARRDSAAWRQSFRATIALLAVNVPLIPLQIFAAAFSVITGLNLIGLFVARRYGATST